jgi:hypothetical protein
MVHRGVAQLGEGKPAEPANDVVGVDVSGGQLVQEFSKGGLVHGGSILPRHDR